jgi:hypothetical protein
MSGTEWSYWVHEIARVADHVDTWNVDVQVRAGKAHHRVVSDIDLWIDKLEKMDTILTERHNHLVSKLPERHNHLEMIGKELSDITEVSLRILS